MSDQNAVEALHDLLMATLPRGWRAVDLELERAGEVTRIKRLDVKADAPATMPPVGMEQADAVAAMNALLPRLADGACERVRVTREPAELVLLRASGEVQQRIDLAPIGPRLVVTDTLFDTIDAAHAELDGKQRVFDEQIGAFREWGFDQDSGALSFVLASGEPLSGVGVLVGSWARGDESWLWAWANSSVPDPGKTAVIRDRAREMPGLAALHQPRFPCSLPLAKQLAFVAAAQLGADGLFGGAHAGGVAFIAALP